MTFTVATVLKSGGDYDVSYVRKLAGGVARNLENHRFVCLTDMAPGVTDDEWHAAPDIDWLPLHHNLPGWWSKLELFELPGPVLFLDLDTVIVGSLANLAYQITGLGERVMMLRGFHRGDWTSGIMGWAAADLRWLLRGFLTDPPRWDGTRASIRGRSYRGDQDYIRERIKEPVLVAVQDVVRGIYSYKVHVRQLPNQELPPDARIVAFHGKPRPAELAGVGWLEANW